MNEKSISKLLEEIEEFELIKLIIDALEKQMPHHLAPVTGVPVCGKCNGIMDLMQGDLNYCPNCGQKIKWGEKD